MMMPEDSTVSCYDGHSNAYDIYQSAVVPHYEDMLEMVAKTCRKYLEPDSTIIDLGCGTGNASLAILKKIPVYIFLIDGSGGMMDIALGKIGCASRDCIKGYKVADLNDEVWDDIPCAGEYDAVVSTLVLEHMSFDKYRTVLRKCFDLLKPGGWLMAVEGYDEKEGDLLQWFNMEMEQRRSRLDPKLADFVAQLRIEKEVHYYSSKSQKEAWWRQAGFIQVNVIWQYLCIALMIGRKPWNQTSNDTSSILNVPFRALTLNW
jgi:SAM-dependent methyltransferase